MKKKLFLTLSGGLGNQLHSLAAAFCIAEVSNRKIIVLLPNYGRKQDLILDLNLNGFNMEIMKNRMKVIPSKVGFFNQFVRKVLRLLSEITFKAYPKIHISSNSHLDVDFETRILRPTFLFMQEHYENTYYPQKAITMKFPKSFEVRTPGAHFNFLLQKCQKSKRKPIIGVHVRLGDYKTWEDGKFLLPDSYYVKKIKSATKKFTEAEIWLFSDQPYEAYSMLYQVRNISNISADYKLSNVEELKLLSMTDSIVSSHSTFSWWACFWNKNQDSIWFPKSANRLPNWR